MKAPLVVTKPRFFATPADFRRWLAAHHRDTREQWVGFYKKSSGKPSITWPESVDEALCFGWIDGLRKTIDGESYMIRFTPRRAGSNWSTVNIGRMKVLIAERKMRASGLAAFKARDPAKSSVYAYESPNGRLARATAALSPKQQATFRKNKAAWAFFQAQPPGYRRLVTHWITSAKQEATRERRLATLISDSEAGERIAQLRRPAKVRMP